MPLSCNSEPDFTEVFRSSKTCRPVVDGIANGLVDEARNAFFSGWNFSVSGLYTWEVAGGVNIVITTSMSLAAIWASRASTVFNVAILNLSWSEGAGCLYLSASRNVKQSGYGVVVDDAVKLGFDLISTQGIPVIWELKPMTIFSH